MFRESASHQGSSVMQRRRLKVDPGWSTGIWLGRSERTNELIVGTKAGVFLTRFIQRLPAEQQHDLELLKRMRGFP